MNLCAFKQPYFSARGINGLEVQWTIRSRLTSFGQTSLRRKPGIYTSFVGPERAFVLAIRSKPNVLLFFFCFFFLLLRLVYVGLVDNKVNSACRQ